MRIRTAVFVVYVSASAIGFAVMMAFVLRDVRLRYVESMRRTLGDTAAYLAAFVAKTTEGEDWRTRLGALPQGEDQLRVFGCDAEGRVIFDSAGTDLGRIYSWPWTGGGPVASENYTVSNVAEIDGELRVAARVKRNGDVLGWVGIGRPLSSIAEGVREARWRLAVSVGGVALVMVFAGWWIAARLTRSVERLTAWVRQSRGSRASAAPASRAREIAELGRAFEELRDALEGRRHAERQAQALAHEVKAPLAAIRGAAELLGEDLPQEDRDRFLANIRGESARIQQLMERLLELSSIEARKALADAENVGVADLIAEAVEVVRAAYEGAGVKLESTGSPRATVRGERVLLREALVNLLQNALDFSPSGGTVRISAGIESGRVVVAVDDDGPGVPEYALSRVFERFYSLPRPGKTKKSTGLGLALVREIALLHGGDATLENRPDGGARATIRVPVV